jgi:hypothetical protein
MIEKTVAELKKELDGLAELSAIANDEPTQPKPTVKVEETKVEKPKAPEPQPPIKPEVSQQPQTPKPTVEQSRPSLDGIIQRAVDSQKQKVDEEAIKKKQQIEDKVFNGLIALIESVVTSSVNPVPVPLPQTPQQLPQPNVKGNTDAIQRINEKLADPDVTNKKSLYLLKMELLGESPDASIMALFEKEGLPLSSKLAKDEEEKKGVSVKGAVAAFFGTLGLSFLVYFGLTLAHII